MKYIFAAVFLLTIFNSVTARNYAITITGSKLPRGDGRLPALYDGNDAIYIVGGDQGLTRVLLRYNIETDTIEVIGKGVPNTWGSAVLNTLDQSIYYFGGYMVYDGDGFDQSAIYKIRLSDPWNRVFVGNLPNPCAFTSSIWNKGEYVYIIGGQEVAGSTRLDTVVRFSKTSNSAQVVARTPGPVTTRSAVRDPGNNVSYIFGGSERNEILMFNETSQDVTKVDAVLPHGISGSCAILIGLEAFIIGGSGSPNNELTFIKFDVVTHEVTRLNVENFPYNARDFACAVVERLNRIYMFGGLYNSSYRDDIVYIDMNEDPVVTTTTTTEVSIPTTTDIPTPTTEKVCPPSGIHEFPYPGNCSLYIKCIQGDPIILSCATSFWFDKIDKICKPAEEAVCDEEIPNICPIDGSYDSFPHGSSCSLYHYCYKGQLYTDECARNAYYDEKLKVCTYAHEAVCHSECPETGVLFLPIRATFCRYCKLCTNGVSTNLFCGDEQIYDPVQEKCVNLGEYTCPY